MIMLEESRGGERHAANQAGRPASPTKEPPGSRLLQASIPPFPQFVCSSFLPRTTVDIANLPKLDSSNNTHP
jgi:hypothetical protein